MITKKSHLIPQPQLLFAQFHTSSKTLRNRIPLLIQLTRKLQTDTSKARAALGRVTEGGCELGDVVVERVLRPVVDEVWVLEGGRLGVSACGRERVY